MKGFRLVALLGAFIAAGVSAQAMAASEDWSTGRGLIENCNAVSIPQGKASEVQVSGLLLCLMQFQTWRDTWTIADAYNQHHLGKRGPICIPSTVTNKALIEHFVGWSRVHMTNKLKAEESSASAFLFMRTAYPCA